MQPTPFSPGHGITPLALQNEPLLRAIAALQDRDPPVNITDLAGVTDRDHSNTSKSLKALDAEGLIDREPHFSLTIGGAAVLAALDRAAGETSTDEDHVELRHDQVDPDPDNARAQSGLEDAIIDAFADGIAEKGILQKPGVRLMPDGRWRLVYGERRWRAWGRLIARGVWPADHTERLVIQRGDDAALLEAGLVENLQRSDLNNLEIAEGLLLLHTRHARTVQQMAVTVNKTERYVQIALKVAKGATQADKNRYIDSENAYRAAKARNETLKREFTWEGLRDSVTIPKHVTWLERRQRPTVMVAELAFKALNDPNALHVTLDGREVIGAGVPHFATRPGTTRISVPPGGGHWTDAELLGLVEDRRADGEVYAGITDLAADWLRDQGFFDAPEAWLAELRTEALGPMGQRLCVESGKFSTDFLNPPKPAPAPVAAPPPAPAAGLDIAGYAADLANQIGPDDTRPPPRDDFAAAIRAVNAGDLSDDGRPLDLDRMPMTIGVEEIETAERLGHFAGEPALPMEPAPTPAAAQGPHLTNLELVALVELAHKITEEGVEARGGALRGARIGNFSNGPGSKEAQGLMLKRLVGFIQAPNGVGFLGHLTQAGWDLVGRVDIARVEEVQFEDLPDGSIVPEGRLYFTDWLTVQEVAKEPSAPSGPQPVTMTDAEERAARQLAGIVEKLDVIHAEAIVTAKAKPQYLPSVTHAFLLADRAVRDFATGDVPGAMAHYARLFATLGKHGAVEELVRSMSRVGVDRKVLSRTFDLDSPDYANAHRNTHGVVTADEHGMAEFTVDPNAPAEVDGQ